MIKTKVFNTIFTIFWPQAFDKSIKTTSQMLCLKEKKYRLILENYGISFLSISSFYPLLARHF